MPQALSFRDALKQAIDPVLSPDDQAKVLLLSCIDLRYPHRIVETMDGMGYRGRYYHLALAGASHAAKHDDKWQAAWKDHLAFAVDHGHVGGVIILDHLDCKAYQLYENIPPGDFKAEKQRHRQVARLVVKQIVTCHPRLARNVHAFLLPVEPPELTPEPIAAG